LLTNNRADVRCRASFKLIVLRGNFAGVLPHLFASVALSTFRVGDAP
jgi:hypothetical protein